MLSLLTIQFYCAYCKYNESLIQTSKVQEYNSLAKTVFK